jgi:putative SOS response-associated peptidase YedK
VCGRYTLSYSDLGDVAAELDAILDPAAAELYRPRYNVAPTDAMVIATHGEGDRPALVPAVWGLHRDKRLVINVRSEAARTRSATSERHAFCVVPADGFYEWMGEKGDRRPLWFHAPDHAPLWMAGVADQTPGEPRTFAVLTGPARPPVASVHSRMPILLTRDHARRILLGEPPRVLVGDEVPLEALAVSPRCNAVANDDPACLDPATADDAKPARKQLGLF